MCGSRTSERHSKGGGATSDLDRAFVELAGDHYLKPAPAPASSAYGKEYVRFRAHARNVAVGAGAKAVT